MIRLELLRSGEEILRGLGWVGDLTVEGVGGWRQDWSDGVVMWPNLVDRLHLLQRNGRNPRLVRQLGLHHPGQIDWLVVVVVVGEVVGGQHGGRGVGEV